MKYLRLRNHRNFWSFTLVKLLASPGFFFMQSKTFMVLIRSRVTGWTEKRVDLLHYQRHAHLIIGRAFSLSRRYATLLDAAYNQLIAFHLIIRDIKHRRTHLRRLDDAN